MSLQSRVVVSGALMFGALAIPASADPVGGTSTGLAPHKTITCKNLTTGQSITFDQRKNVRWNCEAHGLVVSPGDSVSELVKGKVPKFAAALNGLRWELPCTGSTSDARVCTAGNFNTQATLSGQAGTQYSVELRFRGIVEQATYNGGVADGFWLTGGASAGDGWNVYKIEISSPAQTYYLNVGTSNIYRVFAIDYQHTVTIDAGATVSLSALTVDGQEIVNRDDTGTAIVVPDIPPAPAAFNGQFVQMDVVSVDLIGP